MAHMPGKGQSKPSDEEPYCTLIGPESNRTLLFADGQDWMGEDELLISCEHGYVELAEWR